MNQRFVLIPISDRVQTFVLQEAAVIVRKRRRCTDLLLVWSQTHGSRAPERAGCTSRAVYRMLHTKCYIQLKLYNVLIIVRQNLYAFNVRCHGHSSVENLIDAKATLSGTTTFPLAQLMLCACVRVYVCKEITNLLDLQNPCSYWLVDNFASVT